MEVWCRLKTDNIRLVRIVFDFLPSRGGSITHLIELTKHLNDHLAKQTIIAPLLPDQSSNADQSFMIPVYRVRYHSKIRILEHTGLPIVPLVIWGYSKKAVDSLLKFINEYDLIYVHGTLLGAMVLMHLRTHNAMKPVVVLQDSANLFRIDRGSGLAASLATFLFKLNKPDRLIIVDDGGGIGETIDLCKRHRIPYEVVYHAIDTEFFSPMDDEHEENYIVLSTQRLVDFKRVDLGILAFKRFLEYSNFPKNAKLVIAGDGPKRKDLENLCKKEDIDKWVIFLGEKDLTEIRDLLRMASVVIGTSLKSNLNFSIQEAMSCGKPVVAFNAGETNKLIKHFENGILVSNGDVEEFARMLKRLYEDNSLRKKLGENARKTIVAERSWSRRIEQEMRILREILSKECEGSKRIRRRYSWLQVLMKP